MSKKIVIAGCTGICLLLTSVAYGVSGDTGNTGNVLSQTSNATKATVQQHTEIQTRQVITAEATRDKMLNAIDYYTTIQGAYRIIQKPIGVDEIVEFDVSVGDTPGSYVKVKSNVTGEQSEHIANGQTLIHLFE